MEAQIPTCWIPRESDRIWRGSYKGKVCLLQGFGWFGFKFGVNVNPKYKVRLLQGQGAGRHGCRVQMGVGEGDAERG